MKEVPVEADTAKTGINPETQKCPRSTKVEAGNYPDLSVSGVAIIELFSFRREKHTFEKMGLEYIINDILFHMRKKKYLELKQVSEFMSEQSGAIRAEYFLIVDKLEIEGRLEMPFAEKVEDSLFAIRIISTGNIRIFYTYGEDDRIYGIRAYVKKTRNIPAKEMEQARKVLKIMRRENML